MNTTISLAAVFVMLIMLTCQMTAYRHRQKKTQKHDDVLFPFCELRREIIRFLHENAFENRSALSREEYNSTRRLLDVLNNTIQNYNRHKTVMFDLGQTAKYLKQYRDALQQTKPLDPTDNPKIKKFHNDFFRHLIKAFLAYTPFMRSRLVLRCVALAYRAGKEVGERRAAEYVVKHSEEVRNDARRYGLIRGGAAAV